MKITKGEEKHDCSICQAEYKSLAGLKHHISTVHENKGYFCPVCGKKFVQESTLNMHILTNCGKDTKENKCSMVRNIWGFLLSFPQNERKIF